jgi:hypothetical protein
MTRFDNMLRFIAFVALFSVEGHCLFAQEHQMASLQSGILNYAKLRVFPPNETTSLGFEPLSLVTKTPADASYHTGNAPSPNNSNTD